MKTRILMTAIFLLLGAVAAYSISNAQSMDPKIRLVLKPAPENLDDLRALLRRFAEKEELSVYENRLPPKEGKPDFLMVQLRLDDSFMAVVTNGARSNRVIAAFYEPKPNPNFQRIASELEDVLREKWPYIAPYDGR
jgi:hypothetical protein